MYGIVTSSIGTVPAAKVAGREHQCHPRSVQTLTHFAQSSKIRTVTEGFDARLANRRMYFYIDLYSPTCGRQKNMRKNKHRYIYTTRKKKTKKKQ